MATRIAVAGAGGRMGQALIEAAVADPECLLVAAVDVDDSPAVGRDAGERFGRATGVTVGSEFDAAASLADVWIDFTRPEGTLAHLAACARHGTGAVVGTTGFSDAEKAVIADHARKIPVVFAPNMSVGVNVLLALCETAAHRLGPAYDAEIVEIHHKHKIDAPSGTAIRLGEAVAQGMGSTLEDRAVYARQGMTGERKSGAIGFAALRGGDVVGEHTVIFAGVGERIELAHKATSRDNFAAGALRAAHFVATRRAAGLAGLSDMQDVLGLR